MHVYRQVWVILLSPSPPPPFGIRVELFLKVRKEREGAEGGPPPAIHKSLGSLSLAEADIRSAAILEARGGCEVGSP